ncbi:MAG: hypothetical protein NC936_06025 [Candidatus Omnitrophica bacterium]|nr:hypothetical protein [Candidatus Omnitrophota bacterium]
MKNNYICSVDLGSSKLAGMVCIFNKTGQIIDIVMDVLPSKGIRNGKIFDFQELSLVLEDLLKKLQKSSGLKIKGFFTNISANEVRTGHSRAIMPLAERGSRVITDTDLRRINEQAKILGTSLEEEIIHQISHGYIVDGQNYCLNPSQLYAHRLEVDLYLVYARLSYIQNISRLASQLGFSIKGIYYCGLANQQIIFGNDKRHTLDIFCDIGADTVELTVFKDGILQGIAALVGGGDNITEAISKELNIPLSLAQEIKQSWAVIGNYQDLPEEKEVMVKRANTYVAVKQREISRIATEQASRLCQAIKEALDKLSLNSAIDNLVIAGRTVLQEGFLEKLEELTGITVKLARISELPFMNKEIGNQLTSSSSKALTYLNALGLSIYAWEVMQREAFKIIPPLKSLAGVIHKVKEIYQQYF